jgi:hypothetical protein
LHRALENVLVLFRQFPSRMRSAFGVMRGGHPANNLLLRNEGWRE